MSKNDSVLNKLRSEQHDHRKPMLRGVHHLAIVTDDLRRTLDFYVRILGMPLIGGLRTGPNGPVESKTKGNPPFARIPHYFLDMGGDSIIAFFEYPKGEVGKANRDTVGAMQHFSFACSPARYAEMERRLRENDVEIIWGPKVVAEPSVVSMYFLDPNGMRLEITADLDGDDEDLDVVRTMTLTAEGMRRELRTVSDDEAWIEEMVQLMPAPDPKVTRETFGHH